MGSEFTRNGAKTINYLFNFEKNCYTWGTIWLISKNIYGKNSLPVACTIKIFWHS